VGQQAKASGWQDHGSLQFRDGRVVAREKARLAKAVIKDAEAKLKARGCTGLLPFEMAPTQPVDLGENPLLIRQKAPSNRQAGRFYSLLSADWRQEKLDRAAVSDRVVSESMAFMTRHEDYAQESRRLFAALSATRAPAGFQLHEVAVLGNTQNIGDLLVEFSGYDDALRIRRQSFIGFFDYECEDGLAAAARRHQLLAARKDNLPNPQKSLFLSKATECVLASLNLSVSALVNMMGGALSLLIRHRNADQTWLYAEFRFIEGVLHVDAHSSPNKWRLHHDHLIIDHGAIPETVIATSANKPLKTLIGDKSFLGELQILYVKPGPRSSLKIQLLSETRAVLIDP
jgi:hypothetical protein